MRAAITALSMLVVPAASGGVLPIDGRYCGEDLMLTADGFIGEENCTFTKVSRSGQNWWEVTGKCESGEVFTARIEVNGDKTLATIDREQPLTRDCD